MFDLVETRTKMQNAISSLEEELRKLRTGRANPSLVENIEADVYGSKMPLNQLANITIVDASLLTVQAWDKNNVESIVKSIQMSDTGLNPVVDGDLIRIAIPALTEDRRLELVKSVGLVVENSRISIRKIRKDANEKIERMKKGKEISEDDEKSQRNQVQKLVDEVNEQIDEIFEAKKEDLMTI